MQGGNHQEAERIHCWQVDDDGNHRQDRQPARDSPHNLLKHSDVWQGWRREEEGSSGQHPGQRRPGHDRLAAADGGSATRSWSTQRTKDPTRLHAALRPEPPHTSVSTTTHRLLPVRWTRSVGTEASSATRCTRRSEIWPLGAATSGSRPPGGSPCAAGNRHERSWDRQETPALRSDDRRPQAQDPGSLRYHYGGPPSGFAGLSLDLGIRRSDLVNDPTGHRPARTSPDFGSNNSP